MSFVFPKLRTHHSKSSVDLLIECAPLQSRRRAFLNLNLHPEGSSNKVVSPGRDSKWSNALYRTRLPSDSEAKPRRQEERMDVDDRAVATARARASTASTASTAALDNDDADAEAAASRLAAWRSIFFKRRRRKRGEVFSSFFVFLCLARARGERKKKKKASLSLHSQQNVIFSSLSLSPFSKRLSSSSPMTPHRMAAAAALLLLAVASAPSSVDAAAKCITYFVKTPASPFSYKAGFAAWPTTCNPKFYK